VQQHKTQAKEYASLQRVLAQLKSSGALSTDDLAKYQTQLRACKESLDAVRAAKPRTSSCFVRLLMGHVNVKLWKRSEAPNFKVSTVVKTDDE
jgi:hypothetical protein